MSSSQPELNSAEPTEFPTEPNAGGGPGASRPEDLPPVEPPSAGFIVQLFLIPGLIVAAVVGVWVFFGSSANSEVDVEQLLQDLGSPNEHRSWRAAGSLAQTLGNQERRPPKDSTPLSERRDVADALTELLDELLESPSTQDETVNRQVFVARTLGQLKSDDVTLPVLARAMQRDETPEVRKTALASVAMIAARNYNRATGRNGSDPAGAAAAQLPVAGRMTEEPTITDDAVRKELLRAAQDSDNSVRHLAAYCLGVVSGESAVQELRVLTLDGDPLTRANAAVGLALNGERDAVPVLLELLESQAAEPDSEEFAGLPEQEQQLELTRRSFERPVLIRNVSRALASLRGALTPEEQVQAESVLGKLADESTLPGVSDYARTALRHLGEDAEDPN